MDGYVADQPVEKQLHRSLNHWVFWPPFVALIFMVSLNVFDGQAFNAVVTGIKTFIVVNFGWLFTLCSILSVAACAVIALSPFGAVKIGGANAEPLISRWNWFAITVCTSIATGILFWSTAEPIFHLSKVPPFFDSQPNTPAAAIDSLSVVFLHWTITPYCIYAFSYYNMKQPYSLRSMVAALLGPGKENWLTNRSWVGNAIDGICLFALVAGMSASLGTGILVIASGLGEVFGLAKTQWLWAAITAAIVVSFIVSSATGLTKGIRILSDLNTKGLFLLCAFVLLTGPTLLIFQNGWAALIKFAFEFPKLSTGGFDIGGSEWSASWSAFYWAVWLAWAPVTACFLGRISLGRTVRETLVFNLLLPALFSMFWMAVFCTTTMDLQLNNVADLSAVIDDPNLGAENVTYEVFRQLPLSFLMTVFYLFSAFICFVTSADSNTTAMASICSRHLSESDPEGALIVKVLWGLAVGIVAWVMIAFASVEGIKTISVIGGFPVSILFIFVLISLMRIVIQHKQFSRVDQ
jgi:choline-glycine betaine transporter